LALFNYGNYNGLEKEKASFFDAFFLLGASLVRQSKNQLVYLVSIQHFF
jgi:hypothetical protein